MKILSKDTTGDRLLKIGQPACWPAVMTVVTSPLQGETQIGFDEQK
jgi:hypothetical protein